jgi:hypothetical protein
MRKAKLLRNMYGFASFLCNVGLIIYFIIYGYATGGTATKYTMTMAAMAGIVLSVVSAVFKKHWRTPLVLICAGLYFVVNSYMSVLITLAVAIMLDELIFSPLHQHYKLKYTIDREIVRYARED